MACLKGIDHEVRAIKENTQRTGIRTESEGLSPSSLPSFYFSHSTNNYLILDIQISKSQQLLEVSLLRITFYFLYSSLLKFSHLTEL